MWKKITKFVLVFSVIIASIILFIIYYPNLPPNVKFTEYNVKPNLALVDTLAINTKLNVIEKLFENKIAGPEAFAIYNHELYTTLYNGDVIKVNANNQMFKVNFVDNEYNESSRPLGIQFDQNDGTMYVADAFRGIWMLKNEVNASIEYLIRASDKINGKAAKIFNSIALANNGDIYWTDSSTQFDLFDGVYDILADASGRLIKYERKTKKNIVLIDNLHFANGVVLSENENFLLVTETVMSRVHKYNLKTNKHRIFIDKLPGIPDNIQRDSFGDFWLPLVLAGDENHPILFQFIAPYPNIRKFFARSMGLIELLANKLNEYFPNPLFTDIIHYVGHFETVTFIRPKRSTIIHLSKHGEILESLHCSNGTIFGISDAIIFNNYLYLGSPFNRFLARVPLNLLDLRKKKINKF